MITLLAAAALSLYALAGIVAARAEIERYSQTREALSARAQELEEANAGLEELLRQGRADRDSVRSGTKSVPIPVPAQTNADWQFPEPLHDGLFRPDG